MSPLFLCICGANVSSFSIYCCCFLCWSVGRDPFNVLTIVHYTLCTIVYHRVPFAARGKAVRKYQEMSPSEQRRNGDMLSESMPELSLHEGEEETKDSHRKRAKRALHLHRNTGTSVGANGGTGGGDGNKTSPLAKEQSTTTTAATTPVNCECFYCFSVVHRATNDVLPMVLP